jgi:diguanylate cyclase (GGDEF)-like protein
MPLSLLLVDVDSFKAFNDYYGSRAGDTCLRALARAMDTALRRAGDLVARYGGGRFAVLLPDTPQRGAARVAQKLLAEVDGLALPHASSAVADHVTVSIGGVTRPPVEREPGAAGSLVSAADQALHAAKRAGQHRACLVDLGAPAESAAVEVIDSHVDDAGHRRAQGSSVTVVDARLPRPRPDT